MLPSVVEELQRKVPMADAILGEKENAALGLQKRQFQAQRSEYEAKMKSLEETPGGSTYLKFAYSVMQFEADPETELQSLKFIFQSWKKDYRVLLRETKAKVHRLRQDEAEKNRLYGGEKMSEPF
ncbi:myosin-2-like isoform X1 [Olea europaea subsp. europaea]|uniref:Myosin-2-like isoform X1 n=1 Tax=Olea europaea subsp. europaea TaxID=158383 RepID=A0A8S0RTF4_OLEEU|nr:myosin-2-like isoform X1 [Olea europaea subsp. europaea]